TCAMCGNVGKTVMKKTVVHQLKPEKFDLITNDYYWFCGTIECHIVYYAADGQTFSDEDLRNPLRVACPERDRQVCFCFGFNQEDIKRRIESACEQPVSTIINQFIKEKLCACEIRNPSGLCCLGAIYRVEKRCMGEFLDIE